MLSVALLASQFVAPPPLVHIENPSGVAHRVTLRTTWPLPRHAGAAGLAAVSVGGVEARWRPLVRWPDGALALVELSWPEELTSVASRAVTVRWETAPTSATADQGESALPLGLSLRTELEDPWGRTYVARLDGQSLVPDPHRRRWQAVHTSADGVGFLGVVGSLEPGVTPRHAVLTLQLDNGRLRPDRVFGAVRFRRFDLVSETAALRFLPRLARANVLAVAQSELDAEGNVQGYRQRLLGPSDSIYLGDGTAKAFRFDLFWPEDATEAEMAAVAADVASPAAAFPDLDWVRHTRAFGLHGGPAPVAGDAEQIASLLAGAWHVGADFGVFGGFGDPKPAAAQGAPRHGPSALHSVLRLRSPALLRVAEAVLLQSQLRPLPGHVVRAPADARALREGLSKRAQELPHGFEPLGYEQASVDLPFDVYWLTADQLALEEIQRHGAAIRALLADRAFRTCRGEGFCLQALASVALATGDQELVEWLRAHVRTQLLPRLREHPVAVIAQPPHRDVLDGASPFDSPWQMAVLVHGLHAVHRVTEDGEVAAAAVDVAARMAGPGWLEGVGPKYFVSARDPARFEMARDGAPADGPGRFQIGAFVLAAELARDQPDLARLFDRRARELVLAATGGAPVLRPGLRSDPWFQLWLDRHDAARPPR